MPDPAICASEICTVLVGTPSTSCAVRISESEFAKVSVPLGPKKLKFVAEPSTRWIVLPGALAATAVSGEAGDAAQVGRRLLQVELMPAVVAETPFRVAVLSKLKVNPVIPAPPVTPEMASVRLEISSFDPAYTSAEASPARPMPAIAAIAAARVAFFLRSFMTLLSTSYS
ncbi:MAG: hypothetical protein IPO20_22600 [Gammaproteobacteria bacterium]|nr:hypothetical protein [Gammaproteobacteria bacterium]